MKDKHFDMSKGYKDNSSSQQTIGKTVIESAIDMAKSELSNVNSIKILDIACGPGNLTVELKNSLIEVLPETEIYVIGLDYSADNVKRLIETDKDIKGVVGSFYSSLPKDVDFIFSNEGLHWQPPYDRKMSEIIYSHLQQKEKEVYELWAINNLQTAVTNIYNSLKEGGMAVIQFGHEGQLEKLYALVSEVFTENRFIKYKRDVNFPLYYPAVETVEKVFIKAGFSKKNIEIDAFNQPLTEEIPEAITEFLRAFTEPRFSKFFDTEDLSAFYDRFLEKLNEMNVDEFRKDQWHRTLVKVKK